MLEAIASELGRMFGSLAGNVLTALLYLAIALILWGLPCDRIVSKAGFEGGKYWMLFLALFQIVILPPLAAYLFGQFSQVTDFVLGTSAIILLLAFFAIAFLPWPVWKELRQFRIKSGLDPSTGKPAKVKQ